MAETTGNEDVPDKVAKKQLAFFRAKVEEEALEHQQAYLNITPMMDMMTILLVFLLKQFSVQQSAAALSEGLVLPQSTIEQQKPPGVMVQVTQSAIIVDGDPVAPVRSGTVDASLKRGGANSLEIVPLVDSLNKHRKRLQTLEIVTKGATKWDNTATLLIDKNIPYRLVTEVIYSAGQAEFSQYRLSVIKKSQ